jgi:3-hydroxyisobutyrate dehydrogenase-like beta-hydroxyacid dehydrogenase
MSIRNVSVIGLGAMGSSMATLLLKAGYHVKGLDIVKKKMSGLVPLGLKPVNSPKEAAEGADLIILSLVYWDVIQEVVEGREGILAGARKGLTIVDTSTVPPFQTKAMAERLARKGIDWMDIPISGSGAQARVGDIVFMAGGRRSVFDRVKPVLDQVGKKTVYAGKNGNGVMLKFVVSHVLFLNIASACEGLVLARKVDLDPDVTLDALISGAAGSSLIAARGKDMLEGDFRVKGALRMMGKDIGLMMENAKQLGVMLPMSALCEQFILKGVQNGWGDLDGTVIMRIWEQLAGIEGKEGARRSRK